MTDLPLRSISISDFRCLEGDWQLPLDAPIVLLHGPNGTGKTSVLSAIELALTGEIRSMRRQDDRYTAHLPTHGQRFATIHIETSDSSEMLDRPGVMTVGGSRIEGAPALTPEAARFYSERSYLDQVSLGQLLELYQYQEGNEESALARFVNELLGLDQLDALRSGLSDVTDVRRLRKLSEDYAEAENNAKRSASSLSQATKDLESAEADRAREQDELRGYLATLGYTALDVGNETDIAEIERLLASERTDDASGAARKLSRSLIELGGRIKGLASQAVTVRIDDARVEVAATTSAYQEWRELYEAPIAALREDIATLQLESDADLKASLDNEIGRIDARLASHEAKLGDLEAASAKISNLRSTLEVLNTEISQAENRAGSLAVGLTALRDQISSDTCPVCDRDFSELAAGHLRDHVERKISELTSQGRELRALTERRDGIMAQLQEARTSRAASQAGVLVDDRLGAVRKRRSSVAVLRSRLDDLHDAIGAGSALRQSKQQAERRLADLQAAEQEGKAIRSELSEHASTLGIPLPGLEEPIEDSWARLSEAAASKEARLETRQTVSTNASGLLDVITGRTGRIAELVAAVTDAARTKRLWEQRVEKMKQRRVLARSVHNAASDARAAIVHRIFTESLNDVWRDVFSRLAPREPFIPAFGIPTSTKTALELRLETVHSSGDTGGPPSMMLSTGNLNTAALSLFIALHLAVDPMLPCLVFDDPVQSMDEVHIAQLACLLRVLSKQHERQIVVAVHERELFEYLALELSPAYKGDELITIELGRSSGKRADRGVTRLSWSSDEVIAV